jgi:hypothetical protein
LLESHGGTKYAPRHRQSNKPQSLTHLKFEVEIEEKESQLTNNGETVKVLFILLLTSESDDRSRDRRSVYQSQFAVAKSPYHHWSGTPKAFPDK